MTAEPSGDSKRCSLDLETIRLIERMNARQETLAEEVNRLRTSNEQLQTKMSAAENRFSSADRHSTNWPAWISAIFAAIAIVVSILKH